MHIRTKTAFAAILFTIVGFILIFIAFVTPYWLVTDEKIPKHKVIQIGLWQVCLNGFEHPKHLYDTFYGCWWVFQEEYYIIHDILLRDFFIATQFFFTVCMTLILLGSFLLALYTCCNREHQHFVLLLLMIGCDLVLAAISGSIAIIIFGSRGDGRDWMPEWEHNNIGWSFAVAVFGVVFLYIGGILFITEGRKHRIHQEFEEQDTNGAYQLESRKVHTEI